MRKPGDGIGWFGNAGDQSEALANSWVHQNIIWLVLSPSQRSTQISNNNRPLWYLFIHYYYYYYFFFGLINTLEMYEIDMKY